MLIAVCVLSPAHLEHVLGITSFRVRFGGVLRGRFVPRTCFDRVPAGTVLAGTRLFRTRSDYKKWFLPRTCSENMFLLELYWEQVWTPGTWLWKHWYQHMEKWINTAYHHLRIRKAVKLLNDVLLRTRRVLSLYKVYGVIAPFCFSMEHCWIAIMPFWFSAEDKWCWGHEKLKTLVSKHLY